jgi:hypothetical protein
MTNDQRKVFTNTAELNLFLEEKARLKREKAERGEDPAMDVEPNPTPASGDTAQPPVNGPIAPTNRKSANKNAFRHGAYCLGVLPWESREDFEALHKNLKDDWKPVGATQQESVLNLCQWMWTRRRVIQASEISYFRSPVTESLKTGEVTWDDVVQHEASVPGEVKAFISSQIKLSEQLSSVCDKIGEHHYWTNTMEGKEIQLQLVKMKSEIHDLAGRVRDIVLDDKKSVHKAIENITGLFEHAYQPEEIEKQSKLLSMIDREIDKAIKRLIFLKTFNQEFALKAGSSNPPLLNSPPLTPAENRSAEENAESHNDQKAVGLTEPDPGHKT